MKRLIFAILMLLPLAAIAGGATVIETITKDGGQYRRDQIFLFTDAPMQRVTEYGTLDQLKDPSQKYEKRCEPSPDGDGLICMLKTQYDIGG